MSHLTGKFIWFEHFSNDIPKARAFYQPLLDWHIESMAIGAQTYHMVVSGHDGIGGFRSAPAGSPTRWISYLSVPDVDAAFSAAQRAGAKALQPPTTFGDVGRGATLADPTGAVFSLWTSAQGDRADTERVAEGDWCWNELWTADAQTALAFYEKAFGFDHDTLDMGQQGSYYLLKGPDGKQRAGLMLSPFADSPTLWLPYVRVDDCDRRTEQARKLGAQAVLVPPNEIPNIGRFSVVIDPLGAAIALIKLA